MTKKAAALLLAASLAVSVCATPVFATTLTHSNGGSGDDTNNTPPAATNVTYRVDCSYTWSIPKTIDFGANAGRSAMRVVEATGDEDTESKAPTGYGTGKNGTAPKVCVTKNIINSDKELCISIDTSPTSGTTYDSDAGRFYVTTNDEGADKLEVQITYPGGASAWDPVTDPVLTVASGTNTKEQGLEFRLSTTSDEAEAAGIYNGKVVFKSELKSTT